MNTQPFSITRGQGKTQTIRVELDGAPLDLAMASAAQLTITPSALSPAVLLTKTLGAGVVAGAAGYATITLTAADTAAIDSIGSGVWLLVATINGTDAFVARGTVAITGPAQQFVDESMDQAALAAAVAAHNADAAAHGGPSSFAAAAGTNPFTAGLTPTSLRSKAINTNSNETWEAVALTGATTSWVRSAEGAYAGALPTPAELGTLAGSIASGRSALFTGTTAQAKASIGVYEPALNAAGIVLIGSSTFANENTGLMTFSRGPVHNGICLSGSRVRIIQNLAVLGSTIDSHVTQFSAALALKPTAILWQAFSNDIANGASAATLWPTALNLISQCQNERVYLVIRATHWRGLPADRLKEGMKLRQLVQAASLTMPYVKCADAWSVYIDKTVSGIGAAKTNYTEDVLHPSCLGAYFEGKLVWKPIFEQMFSPIPFPTSEGCDSSGSGVNYIQNPVFLGTTGTLGTGAAGVVPTGYTLSRYSGTLGTVTGTSTVNEFGDPAYRMTITGSADGEIFVLSSAPGSSGAAGNYEITARIRIIDSRYITHPHMSLGPSTLFYHTTKYPINDGEIVFTFRETVTTTSSKQFKLDLYLPMSGGAEATVEIDSVGVRWIGT